MGQEHSQQDYIEQNQPLSAKDILESYVVGRKVYNTQEIVKQNPLILHPKKELVYNKACPPDTVHKGELNVVRFLPIPVNPDTTLGDKIMECELRQDIYDYVPIKQPNAVEWWVNFADPILFVAYAGRLFAQDEIQVAEHPALGHLKEKLSNDAGQEGVPRAMTRADGRGTPILIRGIERRCSVAVDANEAEGRPRGLYGKMFASSPDVAIDKATTVIDPPTTTNMIAMAALSGGSGSYNWGQVVDTYTTAYTAFRAAVIESELAVNNEKLGNVTPYVVVHTGNWGCGAFGGSRPLMALVQRLAAQSAGVDKMVYHSFDKEGSTGYQVGSDELADCETKGWGTKQILEACVNNTKFIWGQSDGN